MFFDALHQILDETIKWHFKKDFLAFFRNIKWIQVKFGRNQGKVDILSKGRLAKDSKHVCAILKKR